MVGFSNELPDLNKSIKNFTFLNSLTKVQVIKWGPVNSQVVLKSWIIAAIFWLLPSLISLLLNYSTSNLLLWNFLEKPLWEIMLNCAFFLLEIKDSLPIRSFIFHVYLIFSHFKRLPTVLQIHLLLELFLNFHHSKYEQEGKWKKPWKWSSILWKMYTIKGITFISF